MRACYCPKCGAKQPGGEVLNAEVIKQDLQKSEVEPDKPKFSNTVLGLT